MSDRCNSATEKMAENSDFLIPKSQEPGCDFRHPGSLVFSFDDASYE
jgi:hypothetical protein